MRKVTRKLSLLTALLCLVFTVQGQVQVFNPSSTTFEVQLDDNSASTDHIILGKQITAPTVPNDPGGIGGPENTTLLNNYKWYVYGGHGLELSYADLESNTPRRMMLRLNSTELFGNIGQFRLANDNILVNGNGVSFQGNNLQLGSSLTVDGLGATIDGDLLSVGNSLTANASGLTVLGGELNVGTAFSVTAAKTHIKNDAVLEGAITINDGTDNNFQVTTDGVVTARDVNVTTAVIPDIPDYVFEPDYDLMSIEELKAYIQAHGHLPNIKSAEEYAEIGHVSLAELNLKLLEKVEEQSLYTIQLKEETTMLREELKAMRAELEALKAER